MTSPLRILTIPLALAALTACPPTSSKGIFPFDGHTAVGARQSLVAYDGATEIPPGYPLPRLITVVDLEDGGFIAGQVVADGLDLTFVPDEPWPAGHRIAWTVGDDKHAPHGPELPVPAALAGTAVFSTADAPEVVAVTTGDNSEACLVFSQAIDPAAAGVRISVDDASVEPASWSQDTSWDSHPDGTDMWCAVGVQVAPQAGVRAWIGDRGPWRYNLEDPQAAMDRLYRSFAQEAL